MSRPQNSFCALTDPKNGPLEAEKDNNNSKIKSKSKVKIKGNKKKAFDYISRPQKICKPFSDSQNSLFELKKTQTIPK